MTIKIRFLDMQETIPSEMPHIPVLPDIKPVLIPPASIISETKSVQRPLFVISPDSRTYTVQNILLGTEAIIPTIQYVPRPCSQAIPFSGDELDTPPTMVIPMPTIISEPNKPPYGIRCTCKQTNTDVLLVRCSLCGYFVHGSCVGIARISKKASFVCPYCDHRPIRCNCNNPYKYDEPIIQCTCCKYWVHKSCAGLTFGPNPRGFRCFSCGTPIYTLPYPKYSPNSKCPDENVTITCNRTDVIKKIPEGYFLNYVNSTLDKAELNIRNTIVEYLNVFTPTLFDYSHEFWKVFVSTLSTILNLEKSVILEAIDELVMGMFYIPLPNKYKSPIPGLTISDSIRPNIESAQFTKLEELPAPAALSLNREMHVITQKNLENGEFICDLPGLLCHEDEVDATKGLLKYCINIPSTNYLIDVSRSSNTYVKYIRRSFNFNCYIKIVRVNGELHICLYAMRTKGPLVDEKTPRGPHAITEGGELFLPIDIDLPYPVDKILWKIKKTKAPPKQKPKTKPKPKPISAKPVEPKPKKKKIPIVTETRAMKTRSRSEFPFALSLLSSFLEDACPPIPIIIKDRSEIEEEHPDPESMRARLRNPQHRHILVDSE